VASPLGFTEGGRRYYREVYLPALSEVVTPVDPWALTAPEEFAAAKSEERRRKFALEIGRRNVNAIRSCQVLAAYLEGQELDSGTVIEVGYAAALGLRCVGLRTDLRESGDVGVSVNLQVEAIILDSGGMICTGLDALIRELGRADTAPAR